MVFADIFQMKVLTHCLKIVFRLAQGKTPRPADYHRQMCSSVTKWKFKAKGRVYFTKRRCDSLCSANEGDHSLNKKQIWYKDVCSFLCVEVGHKKKWHRWKFCITDSGKQTNKQKKTTQTTVHPAVSHQDPTVWGVFLNHVPNVGVWLAVRVIKQRSLLLKAFNCILYTAQLCLPPVCIQIQTGFHTAALCFIFQRFQTQIFLF